MLGAAFARVSRIEKKINDLEKFKSNFAGSRLQITRALVAGLDDQAVALANTSS